MSSFFSSPAFSAAAFDFIIDFLDLDAVKGALDKVTGAVALLLWSDKEPLKEAARLAFFVFTFPTWCYVHKLHQRAWSRLRPRRSTETILPLHEITQPPPDMYL